MSKRPVALLILLVLLGALLSGCMTKPRSETIIIPDFEENIASDPRNEAIAVKTIYRLPVHEADKGNWLGWMGIDAVLGVYGGAGDRSKGFEKVDYPYNERTKLWDFDKTAAIDSLSPDGSYASFVQEGDEAASLSLVSISDRKQVMIEQLAPHLHLNSSTTWSSNSRYLSYVTQNTQDAKVTINVYDAIEKSLKQYAIPNWQRTDYITYVKIADDGLGALVVKTNEMQSDVLFGSLKDSEFATHYIHAISYDGSVDWLTNDQIAFVAPDGSLFAYDRRNGAASTLLKQVGSFQVSQDRRYIAYSQGDMIYAGKLQGNNILYEKSIYQGLVPAQMAWSTDSSKLLIDGWKPYAQQSRPAVRPANNQPFVITFK
ncbi:hypothetical protein [Paenibacillus sp. FJAT-27812]|uniref:hypothetical protein n=1 Tax=Paenibacillus sp. FJAT-27812 TaxID=1684143 RepID=UPI0006A7A850|nr:hypothetical protein [Paenibacillus sp. FJAT-27812]